MAKLRFGLVHIAQICREGFEILEELLWPFVMELRTELFSYAEGRELLVEKASLEGRGRAYYRFGALVPGRSHAASWARSLMIRGFGHDIAVTEPRPLKRLAFKRMPESLN